MYYRLNQIPIHLPSLRERKEDIALFANHFLDLANEELHKCVVGFDEETLDIFQNYNWPGNLRQMKNVVKRATLLAKGSLIGKNELPHELLAGSSRKVEVPGSLRDESHEKMLIMNALKSTNNNKTKAAVLLKIDRKTLYNKMKLYGLD